MKDQIHAVTACNPLGFSLMVPLVDIMMTPAVMLTLTPVKPSVYYTHGKVCNKNYTFCPQGISVFSTDFRTSSSYFLIQQLQTAFYNPGGVCLLRRNNSLLTSNNMFLSVCRSQVSGVCFPVSQVDRFST